MDFKSIFSSRLMPQLFLYLIIGLVIIAGIIVLTYEIMDIVKLQQSVSQYEQNIEQRVVALNKHLESDNKGSIGPEEEESGTKDAVMNLAQLEESGAIDPFQPRLEREKSNQTQNKGNDVDNSKTTGQNKQEKIRPIGIKLVGLLVNPKVRIAILKMKDGYNEMVHEGEMINNFVVKKIMPERVIIMPVVKNKTSEIERLAQEFVLKLGGEDN